MENILKRTCLTVDTKFKLGGWGEGLDFFIMCEKMNCKEINTLTYIKYLYFLSNINIIERYKVFICNHFGHKYEIYGNFTPDSGSETATCKRCGQSHSINYY